MDPNNLLPNLDIPSKPKIKWGKIILIGVALFLIIAAIGLIFRLQEGPLLKNKFLTYAECAEKTQLPCIFNFVGDLGHEWTPSSWRSEEECLSAFQQVGRTCLIPSGNFKEVRWVGSGDIAAAEREQGKNQQNIYKNNQYGFQFNYPNDWKYNESQPAGAHVVEFYKNESGHVLLSLTMPAAGTALSSLYDPKSFASQGTQIIGGETAEKRFRSASDEFTFSQTIYLFPSKGLMIMVNSDDNSSPDIEQILSSFKFTNK